MLRDGQQQRRQLAGPVAVIDGLVVSAQLRQQLRSTVEGVAVVYCKC